ncbi:hypothetical protein E2C01_058475 [Portunus trituberculatus]|uniref:Uncharacterized protein n=1 Tax=Portunus trituberculatus TaxID=210409 RepID=A0A5B7GVN6_PORTR|nr:hypothetical protein [Portunus trituberculatus]
MCPSEVYCKVSVNVVSQCRLQAVLRSVKKSVWSVAKSIGVGVCLCCCPVGHGVPHDTDMGGHPLKVDGVSPGGQVEDEVVNDKGEVVVGVWAVGFYDLEGKEGVRKEGY